MIMVHFELTSSIHACHNVLYGEAENPKSFIAMSNLLVLFNQIYPDIDYAKRFTLHCIGDERQQ